MRMTPSDDRFIARVWIPIWEAAYCGRGIRRGARLLRTFPAAVAEHLHETSDQPRADWRRIHGLLQLQTPRMPVREGGRR